MSCFLLFVTLKKLFGLRRLSGKVRLWAGVVDIHKQPDFELFADLESVLHISRRRTTRSNGTRWHISHLFDHAYRFWGRNRSGRCEQIVSVDEGLVRPRGSSRVIVNRMTGVEEVG